MDEPQRIVHLFVYGTLRRHGIANHLLKDFSIVKEGVWVEGYDMFDAGWYPFVVRGERDSKIIGDIYEIPEWKIPELDEYEGSEYVLVFSSPLQAYLYIKRDQLSEGYQKILDGDWLKYWKRKKT